MKQKLQQLSLFIVASLVLPASLLVIAPVLIVAPVNAQNLEKAAKCGSDINFNVNEDCQKIQNDKAIAKCHRDHPRKTEAQCREFVKPSSQIENTIKTIINVFVAIVGSIAVIMVIIGGFKYVTSGGDSNQATSARNTILFAIVGLIIVVFAQVIVRFVLQRT